MTLCSRVGCANLAIRGGVCIRHGAHVRNRRCSSEGCTNQARRGGVCRRHGARPRAVNDEATAFGSEFEETTRVRCVMEGCTYHAHRRGLCWRHSARARPRLCSSEGCTNRAQLGGLCMRHEARPIRNRPHQNTVGTGAPAGEVIIRQEVTETQSSRPVSASRSRSRSLIGRTIPFAGWGCT